MKAPPVLPPNTLLVEVAVPAVSCFPPNMLPLSPEPPGLEARGLLAPKGLKEEEVSWALPPDEDSTICLEGSPSLSLLCLPPPNTEAPPPKTFTFGEAPRRSLNTDLGFGWLSSLVPNVDFVWFPDGPPAPEAEEEMEAAEGKSGGGLALCGGGCVSCLMTVLLSPPNTLPGAAEEDL